MTPKEKAEELVLKFTPYMYCYMGSGMLSNDYDKNVVLDFAKKCAIISVEETLKVVSFYNDSQAEVIYFKEVKQEIEKL
jgi:hypothetical protein